MEREINLNKTTSPGSEDKDKPVASQVLEYYQKYSLSRELPKYFCGASSSQGWGKLSTNKPSWYNVPSEELSSVQTRATVAVNTEVIEDKIEPSISIRIPIIEPENLCDLSQISNTDTTTEHIRVISPASSATSNRKLEWDNGADIGYSNVSEQRGLQKSISLPILNSIEYEKLQRSLLGVGVALQTQGGESRGISNVDKNSPTCVCMKTLNPSYSSSTSESLKRSKTKYVSSSTSECSIHQKQYSDSESSSENPKCTTNILQFSETQVGLPIAESTPLVQPLQKGDFDSPIYSETPKLSKPKNDSVFGEKLSNSFEDIRSSNKIENGTKKWHSQLDLNMVDRISHYKNMKILKLSVSKPVVVDCIGVCEPQKGKNKFIQTSLPRGTSIAVQTDFDFSNSYYLKRSGPKYVERQSILYVCHSDSDKDKNTQSSATQTNSDVVSNCNSFEYLYGADIEQNLKGPINSINDQMENIPGSSTIPVGTSVMDRFLASNLKKCPPKSDLTNVTPVSDSDKTVPTSSSSQNTSKGSPLAQLLSYKQSEQLIPDLEIKLGLLQKVLKSQKYDPVTKKYYLKKIVQNMVDTKYVDDASGSYNASQAPSQSSEINSSGRKSSSGYQPGSEPSLTSNQPTGKTNLQDNKPWKPIQHASQVVRGPKKLQTHTFVTEIVPDCDNHLKSKKPQLKPTASNFVPIQIIQNKNDRLQRNPLLTLTNQSVPTKENAKIGDQMRSGTSSNSTANELYEVLNAPAVTSTISSSLSSKQNVSNNVKGNGYRSWREDKTFSEQLFEQKIHGESGDSGKFENKNHIISFARKERQHQLYWINNEISHLNKLKHLLEQKKSDSSENSEHKALNAVLQEPHVEDMKGIKKSTTVYVVTTEQSSKSSKCTTPCNSHTCKNPRCPKRSHRGSVSSSKNSSAPADQPVMRNRTDITSTSSARKERSTNHSVVNDAVDLTSIPIKPPSLIGRGENVVEIDNEKIDFKDARLVSSEIFTTTATTTCDKSCKTSIRRYTFEIPIESQNTEELGLVRPSSPCCRCCNPPCCPCSSEKDRVSQQFAKDNQSSHRSSSPKSTQISTQEQSRRKGSFPKTTQTSIQEQSSYKGSLPKSTQISTQGHSSRKGSLPKSTQVSTQEQSSRKDSLPKTTQTSIKEQSSYEGSLPKSTQISTQEQSSRKGSLPKTTQTLSQELVVTEEFVSKQSSILSEYKPAVLSKETKSPRGVGVQKDESNSSSSTTDTESEDSSTSTLCPCCKRCSVTRHRRSPYENNDEYGLCHSCYIQHQTVGYSGGKPCYLIPGHICACYGTSTKSDTVQKIQDTIEELDDLERREARCRRKDKRTTCYCKRCKCKVQNKPKKNKGGLAYVLNLESDDNLRKKSKKKHSLPEITIKVKSPRRKKRGSPRSSKQPLEINSYDPGSSEESVKENASTNSRHHKKSKKPTLQQYLYTNKPYFIAAAEKRRQALLDLTYMREKRCQKYKQLLALTQALPSQNSYPFYRNKPRVFAPEEMRAITAKNYRKLPEVRQKKFEYRQKQIRLANKFLTNMFNEKLRQQVLRGQHNVPADANVVNLAF